MAGKQKLLLLPGLLCDPALWAHPYRYLSEIADIAVADFSRSDSLAAMADAVICHRWNDPMR